MISKWLVVTEQTTYPRDTEMTVFGTDNSVLRYVGVLADEVVKNIFNVNEYGEVKKYVVVFDGKLKLEEVRNNG